MYRRQTLFSYSAVSDVFPNFVDNGIALELVVHPQGLLVVHRSLPLAKEFECLSAGQPLCSSLELHHWTHLSVAINATDCRLSLRVNGTEVYGSEQSSRSQGGGCGTARDLPLPSTGHISFGVEPGIFTVRNI